MEKLEKLYEGKAKQLYATDDPEVLWVEYKNTATAGDGEKKEDFTGKGRLNNLITTIIFDQQPAHHLRHRQRGRLPHDADLVHAGRQVHDRHPDGRSERIQDRKSVV